MSKTAIEDLRYDPKTGFLWWTTSGTGRKLTTPVGTLSPSGYRNVTLGRKQYKAHQVVWFLNYGYWPSEVDHINRNKDDNRIENLREVTRSQQQHNRLMPTPSSGVIGASYCKKKKKYKSAIRIDGKSKHLGYFNCPTAASLAYLKEKQYV